MPEAENPSPRRCRTMLPPCVNDDHAGTERIAEPVAPPPLTAMQLALYAGWTMAVLYGNLQDGSPSAASGTADGYTNCSRRSAGNWSWPGCATCSAFVLLCRG